MNPVIIVCSRYYESFKEGYTSGGGKQTWKFSWAIWYLNRVSKDASQAKKGWGAHSGRKEVMSNGLQA